MAGRHCDYRRDGDRRRQCGRLADGSVGMLRLCAPCFAKLCGWSADDPRLAQRVTIRLHDDGTDIGIAEWVPDKVAV